MPVRWIVYRGTTEVRRFVHVEDAERYLEEGLGCWCEDDDMWKDEAGEAYYLRRVIVRA